MEASDAFKAQDNGWGMYTGVVFGKHRLQERVAKRSKKSTKKLPRKGRTHHQAPHHLAAWRPGPSLSTGHNSYRTLPPDALSLIRMSEHVCLLTSPLQSAPLLSGLPALRLTYLLYWEPAQLLGNLLGKVPLSLIRFDFWGFFRAIPSGSGPGFGLRALVQA